MRWDEDVAYRVDEVRAWLVFLTPLAASADELHLEFALDSDETFGHTIDLPARPDLRGRNRRRGVRRMTTITDGARRSIAVAVGLLTALLVSVAVPAHAQDDGADDVDESEQEVEAEPTLTVALDIHDEIPASSFSPLGRVSSLVHGGTRGGQAVTADEVVERVAELLEYYEGVAVEVSGHTDSRGDADYNHRLSEDRAGSVVDALVDAGAPTSQLTAYGESADPRTLAERLDEGLDVLTGLWSGEPFDHDGTHFSVAGAQYLPTPVQQPRIPVWAGCTIPHTRPLRRAARWDGLILAAIDDTGSIDPVPVDEVRRAKGTIEQFRDPAAGPMEVAVSHSGLPGDEELAACADAGVTWVLVAGWIDELDEMIELVDHR